MSFPSEEARRQQCLLAAESRRAAKDETGRVVDLVDEDDSDNDEVQVLEQAPPKKARRTDIVLLDWRCSHCRYDNVSQETTCAQCDEVKGSVKEQVEEQPWACQACSVLNVLSKFKCTACGVPSSPPRILDRIKIFTLNVAGFGNSYAAPNDFDPFQTFSQELTWGNPDIICLQEAMDCDDQTFKNLLPGYVCLGKAASHSEKGPTMLFVKESLAPFATVIPIKGPVILARLEYAQDQTVVIGTCHLMPKKEGAPERLAKTKEMLAHCQPEDMVLLAGDFNVRQAEDPDYEALGLQDAWKETGSEKSKRFTWNSFLNRYHESEFLRGRTGRYDRIYFRGFAIDDFEMCANEEISDNRGHYLSDHFGLRATVRVEADV